ncbi:MAG: hypothetical protein KA020_03340 [Planctomycetes bacterium]|nr:hypothetical protein [Planctomycetota bacterium]MCC7061653.1 hypothetical protein [Planctomycetota bacterium]
MTRIALLASILLTGCAGLSRESHALNPLGWPAKAFTLAGGAAADSGWPLVRETGRLFCAIGELAEAPALAVEGLVTLDGNRLGGAGQQLLVGTGSTFTAAWNVPFFVMPGGNIDLARDVDLVNEALMTMEQLPPQAWRIGPDDARTSIFPPGTRARASGQNVIYTIPGHGEVLQAAEANQAWNFLQWSFGTDFPAQERSWGFVVRSGAHWDKLQPRQRALTILHEFYHQHMQMRQWLLGWTLVYWPAYQVTFPFTGWHDHWAEMGGPHAAGVVDRALGAWSQI